MPMYKNIQEAMSDNSNNPCKAEGCHRNRSRISGYCPLHTAINWQSGHPLHQKIMKGMYAIEKAEVKELIDKNIEHEGIQEGIRFFEGWLNDSLNGLPRPCSEHLKRLKEDGVSGYELLVESAAFFLFGWDNPRVIKSDRHFTYQLGNRILRYKPFNIRGTALHDAGSYIKRNVGGLLVTIMHAVQRKEELLENRLRKYSQPLNVDANSEARM